MQDELHVLSYGGGTNSTAELILMVKESRQIDLILFADTGGEKPDTYAYVSMMSDWLVKRGYPAITTTEYCMADGTRLTLEGECLKSKTLPAIAYGRKACSVKHKIVPQEQYVARVLEAQEVWRSGGRVTKYVGYDAGEQRRKENSFASDIADKHYEYIYPLIDWYNKDRAACMRVIEDAGLLCPGKSSCFFCPNMRPEEILMLRDMYPDLLRRAIAIEENAQETLRTIKGLGRDYAWHDLIYGTKDQVKMCGAFDPDPSMPCECYDG